MATINIGGIDYKLKHTRRRKTARNWEFYYKENGAETVVGRQVCKNPDRTKIWKNITKMARENENIGVQGWRLVEEPKIQS